MRRALGAGEYGSVTIEGLASDAGVSKQTIYRWWSSKAAILGEALRDGTLPSLGTEPAMTDDLDADLRAWFHAAFSPDAAQERVEIARALIAVSATDPELGAVLNERLAAPVSAWVVDRITHAQRSGAVRPDVDPQTVADHLIATMTYSSLLGRTLDIDQAVGLLLRGIAARS